ncbi:MAG TPA: PP2C family serine/threonine-protein phosphatase [Symbiobacteriaceae bacterium]|jgi:protein phosphatase
MDNYRVVMATDRGQVRPTNEDYAGSYIPPDSEIRERLGSLFIIADGIGGRNAGEVASAEAVASLQQEYYFGRYSNDPGKRLEQATARANFHVFDMSWAMASASNMGCAMTALLICRGRYYVSHVGDTELLLIRGGAVRKLTSDHATTGPRSFSASGIFNQRAPRPQARSFLTRAIGMEMSVRPEILDGAALPGDRFVLTTDGIRAHLNREELTAALLNGQELEAAVPEVLAECNRRGGQDNMTLMVVALTGAE